MAQQLPEVARGWWSLRLEVDRDRPAGVGVAQTGVLPAPAVHGDGRAPMSRCGTLAAVLILVRHGRTALNAAGLLQGRRRRAARRDRAAAGEAAVAERIGAVDELVVQPAAPGAARRPTPSACAYTVDERWIELAYGIYEGVPHADVPSEAWRQWRGDPSFVPEGGESLAALDARVRAACDELAERADGRNIAVVSHVSPIKCAVAWALGAGIEISWRSHLSHASICRIDAASGRAGAVLVQRGRAGVAGWRY